MLTVFWNMKGPIPIDFLEKVPTVKIANSFGNISPFLLNDPHI